MNQDSYSPTKDDLHQQQGQPNPPADSFDRKSYVKQENAQQDQLYEPHPHQSDFSSSSYVQQQPMSLQQQQQQQQQQSYPQFQQPQQYQGISSAQSHQHRHIQDYNQQMILQFELQRQYKQQQEEQQSYQLQNTPSQPLQHTPSQPLQQPHQQVGHPSQNLSLQYQYQQPQLLSQPQPQSQHKPHTSFLPHLPQNPKPLLGSSSSASAATTKKSNIPTRVRTPENAASSSVYNSESQPGSARKRHRRSDSSNVDDLDNELKTLAFEASQIPLTDLALKIKAVENDDTIPESKPTYPNTASSSSAAVAGSGSSSTALIPTSKERQRQVFAMVWLLGSCDTSPTAVVPRNRIYARYVQICAENSLKPLSPASFGKLVRILFPNLTTRRLGMRGQSKYHYCGIKLVGDNSFQEVASSQSPASASSSYGLDSPQSLHTPSFNGSPVTIGVITPSLNFSTPSAAIGEPTVASTQYHQQYMYQQNSLKYIPNLISLVDRSLGADPVNRSPLALPSIYPYLPRDSDYDIADTLYSLYRVHCTTIFDSLRFMQIKKLFSAFSNFTGILTAPVSKLYVSENVFEWVKECDSVMYRAMIKMLTKLHLQNVPEDVLQNLKLIAAQYIEKLSYSIQNKVPKNFVVMKLVGAQKFVKLLTRLIRVIETGQSATRILNNPDEKQAMIDDWLKLDINEIVLREVPCSNENLDTLLGILGTEFLTLFDMKGRDDQQQESEARPPEGPVLAAIAAFVASLPARFSHVNTRLFFLVTSNLLTTCLREISLAGGVGFGAWWVVRCWVDEYLYWYFELGGILYEEFRNEEPLAVPPLKVSASQEQIAGPSHQQQQQQQQQRAPSAPSRPEQQHLGHRRQQSSMQMSFDDPESDLRARSVVDLLGDTYQFDTSRSQDSAEGIIDYEHVGLRNY